MRKPTTTGNNSQPHLTVIPFNALANRLFIEELKAKPDNDIALSPLSIELALAMVASGASVDRERLPFEGHYERILAGFNRQSPGFDLRVKNGIFSRKGVDYVPGFLHDNLRHFGAQHQTLDLCKETSSAAIRNWVSAATRFSAVAKANSLAETASIRAGTSMLLINTIAFAGLYGKTALKTHSPWRAVLSAEDLNDSDLEPLREAKTVFAEDERERLHDSLELSFSDSAYSEVTVPPHSGCRVTRKIILAKQDKRNTHELLALNAISSTAQRRLTKDASESTSALPVEARELRCESELDPEVLAGWMGAGIAFVSSVKHGVVCSIDQAGVQGAAVTCLEIGLSDSTGSSM